MKKVPNKNDKNQRLREIKKILDAEDSNLTREQIEPYLREWVEIAEAPENAEEQAQALARLSWLIADQNPTQSIELALKADVLSSAPEIEELAEDSQAVAYRTLGDSVRAKQHWARATSLRKGAGPTFRGIMRNFRYGSTRSAIPGVRIDLSKDGP